MKNRLVLCLVALAVAAPETAAAATRRVAIVLGNNAGGPLDKPLHYAEEDAGKMADVLAQIGDVRSSDLFVLRAGSREQVRDSVRPRRRPGDRLPRPAG